MRSDDTKLRLNRFLSFLKATDEFMLPNSKSAQPIDRADLYAYPIMCASTFASGGVKITRNGEVVNREGHPIPGLSAAGKTVGLYYDMYVGATSMMRRLVFGRRAGMDIARRFVATSLTEHPAADAVLRAPRQC